MADPLDHWPLPGATDLRDRLLAAYDDPARGYHDRRHLAEVCERIAELAGHADDGPGIPPAERDTVLLAAWFHDAVYDGERDAEERSAVWAELDLPAAGVPLEVVTEVARLVRLTETHCPEEDDRAGCVLSDADLAILAAPAGRYEEYTAGVREEFAHVPDPDFRTGRAAVLRDLLSKPRLFHTPYALEHWEQSARANVEAELAALSGHAEVR